MLHKYRKIEPVEAEQFDGSDEMLKRYSITVQHYDLGTPDPDALTVYDFTDHGFPLNLELGDWIITDENDNYTVLKDSIFRQTYKRCD